MQYAVMAIMKNHAAGVVRAARPRAFFRRVLAAVCAASALVATCGRAQQAQTITGEATLINWWYSATFGTGIYKVGPITATVVRLPFSYRVQSMEGGSLGVNLLLPVTVAAYHLNLNELDQFNPRHYVAAASVLPGVEVEIPATERWRLKPYAQAGVGSEFADIPLVAFMHTVGVKSLYRFPGEDYRVSLGNALFLAGYRIRDGSARQGIGAFQIGLNMETPWSMDLWNGPAHFNTHVITTSYYSRLAFANPEPDGLPVYREYEVGFSFRAGRPVSIMGFGADTFGLGFRFAQNVRGVNLYTEFPF
ncbi:MAG TPA: hypothetical protein VFA36_02755 [Burkholderiales bacterium]|nr:hypothetical protein [Burkholderiales bacterium]